MYWPDLPSSLEADVNGFKELLADTGRKAAFVDKLPTAIAARDRGSLVVTHTNGYRSVPFQAAVVYEVNVGNARHHYDLAGKRREVDLE